MVEYVARGKSNLKNRTINICLDNDNANAALVRGGSDTEIVARSVCIFWKIVQGAKLTVCAGRVASKIHKTDALLGIKLPHTRSNAHQNLEILYKLTIRIERAFIETRPTKARLAWRVL